MAERAADAADASPASEAPADATSVQSDALRQARLLLLQRAKERYEAGRQGGSDARAELERALDALRLAYRLRPAPWMLFNLAQVQSQLGSCHDATELYRRFLASDPGPEARASAEQALALLGPCGELPEPTLDDGLLPAPQLPSSDQLPAALGSSLGPALLEGEDEPDAVAAAGDRPWLWAFAGMSATSALVAAVFYGEARAAEGDLDRLRVAGPRVIETRDRGETALKRARAFGGLAAGLALVAGATYWFPSPASDERSPNAASGRFGLVPLEGGAVGAYAFDF